MKRICSVSVMLLLMFSLIVPSLAKTDINEEVILGGMPFGVRYSTNTVCADSFCDVNGQRSPASSAGIQKDDIIYKINGSNVSCATDVISAIEASAGKTLKLDCKRGEKELTVDVTPIKSDVDGKYKIGILIRDSSAGIGTITYINPKTHEFGGLGHGICKLDTGELVMIDHGIVNDVKISSILKGICGTPGELRGIFDAKKIGALIKNTDCGVFGYITDKELQKGKTVNMCPKNEVKKGNAEIICCLDSNESKTYSIKIDLKTNDDRCFSIEITDPALLEKTGGIVQGMSGSPIIQNGKLIGAVTHVLVNDPTRGYGIFIEEMINVHC